MATCKKCGADMDENAKQLPCLRRSGRTGSRATATASRMQRRRLSRSSITLPTPQQGFDSKDITDNKVMAVLAYIGILFLIPLTAAPDSDSRVSRQSRTGSVPCGGCAGRSGRRPWCDSLCRLDHQQRNRHCMPCLHDYRYCQRGKRKGEGAASYRKLQADQVKAPIQRGGSDRSRPFRV